MVEQDLGSYLRELRKSFNYSQEFVAFHLNITRQTYSHYETGRITPPSNSLYNLAKLYGVPVENFLDFIVTYSIAPEVTQTEAKPKSPTDLDDYIEFINQEKYEKKFKYLDQNERLLMYYYHLLDVRDKQDLLSFLKIRCESHEYKKSPD